MSGEEDVKFQPFSSSVEPGVWHSLRSRKLTSEGLSTPIHEVFASYQIREGSVSAVSSRLTLAPEGFQPLDDDVVVGSIGEETALGDAIVKSLNEERQGGRGLKSSPGAFEAPGWLLNVNTAGEFKAAPKAALAEVMLESLKSEIASGVVLSSPERLNRWLLLCFADIKAHKYVHWTCWPVLASEGGRLTHGAPPRPASELFVGEESWTAMFGQVGGLGGDKPAPVWLVHGPSGETGLTAANLVVAPLSDWPSLAQDSSRSVSVVFADPSSVADAPGWSARNLVTALIASAPGVSKLSLVAMRLAPDGTGMSAASRHFQLNVGGDWSVLKAGPGWEPNKAGRMGPRVTDLEGLMDPARLAAAGTELNLKLMRWRQAPGLELEKLSGTKALILGAGTLGCNVARGLLGWGFNDFTFVDNGYVRHSNPARQSLFNSSDAVAVKTKVAASVDGLKAILPLVNARGILLTIPMPGHPVEPGSSAEKQAKAAVAQLEEEISKADVVFLGTDSRESRWLPSVIAGAHKKLLLNTALGFDSYVVMRHGIDQHLGCYFCNDVVAPMDSITDRSLDQMCTVTRPGLSAIAAATAVELAVSVMHAPEGAKAPAPSVKPGVESEPGSATLLGPCVHQLRGYLGRFDQVKIVGAAYDKCTACSKPVLEAYSKDGWDFVKKVLNDPMVLEELTGLSAMKAATEAAVADWDMDGDSDDDF